MTISTDFDADNSQVKKSLQQEHVLTTRTGPCQHLSKTLLKEQVLAAAQVSASKAKTILSYRTQPNLLE